MEYKIATGVKRSKKNIKKIMIGAMASLTMLAVPAGTALASSSGDGSDYSPNPKASACGQYHGAFDAFGKDYNFAGGADGQATGAANSAKGCQRNL